MHYDYGPGTLALVAADGVILGLARYNSGIMGLVGAIRTLRDDAGGPAPSATP
jgi:hypothetical protein